MELRKLHIKSVVSHDTAAELDGLTMAARWWMSIQLSGRNQAVYAAMCSDADCQAHYRDQESIGGRDCIVYVFADGSAINYTNGEDTVYESLDTMADQCDGATREESDDSARGYRVVTMTGWEALVFNYPALDKYMPAAAATE